MLYVVVSVKQKNPYEFLRTSKEVLEELDVLIPEILDIVLDFSGNMENFHWVVRSLLDFNLVVEYRKCSSKVRKYGPKMRKNYKNDVPTEL